MKTQILPNSVVEQITSVSSEPAISESRSDQGRPQQIAESEFFVSLAHGRVSARVFASSGFCPASECGVDTWAPYTGRAWSMVRMKETLTLTVPPGSYPAGLDVQLPVEVTGLLSASGDSQAAAIARYFVQLTRPDTFDNHDSGVLRAEGIGPTMVPIDEDFVLEVFLVAPGTTLSEPLELIYLVNANLGLNHQVSVQGRSADVQGVAETDLAQSLRFGCLQVPEGVTVASASGVFLQVPCSPGFGAPGLGRPALAALAALLAAAGLLLGARRSLRAAT